uniref:Protein Wnt n=1 Tax=Haemonchus contortus TaxID=6289 RepID=A0A7I5E560_HAECO
MSTDASDEDQLDDMLLYLRSSSGKVPKVARCPRLQSKSAKKQGLFNISLRFQHWFMIGVLLLLAHTSQHITPPPAPLKLLQGCGPDLLHSRTFRSVQIACRNQPSTVIAAFEGIQDAMSQCADRMRFQQWDCTNVGHIMHDPPILKYGYRESALIWALSSAGAAWGVATACAQGWIDDCSCIHDGQPGWEYGGCSYSVQHGITASRKLLTRTPIVRTPLRSVEKHNLKAGRLAVKKTLIASCKCHGVSGSCQQKTCWKRTATLDHIADYLIEKYARSKLLSPDQKAKNADLVFIEPSPDPCLQMTTGRVCAWRNETHTQGDCSRLCCGKGFKITHEVLHYKCDCKFVWCCKLICKDCLQHRWVSTCK